MSCWEWFVQQMGREKALVGFGDGTYYYYLASDTSNGYVQTAVKSFTMSQYGILAEDMFSNIQQKQHWNPAGEIITFSLSEGVSPADVDDLRVYYRTKGGSYTAANSEALQVQDDGSYILLLTGLTPETDYQYLIVLTKTSGELYMSAEHGFRALHDTDGDGMCDGEEDYGWMVKRDLNGDGDTDDVISFSGVTYYKETLLPLGQGGEIWSSWDNPDSDNDGLTDMEEKERYTHPMFGDTDHDGLGDSFDTMNPLTDLKITFTIKEILQLDAVDDGSGSDTDNDNTAGDFYVKIRMDANGDITWKNTAIPIEKDNADVTAVQKLVFPVSDDIEEVTFTVYLYDDDSGTGELCDISPSNNYYATLHYSLKNSTWWGDDYVSYNRDRHLNGTNDGSNSMDENDCNLLFDINMNDVDGDKVTYWREENNYHTNPISDDTDKDGLKDDEEIFVYGINPNDPDIDDDGIMDGDDWITPTEWGFKDELILTWPYKYSDEGYKDLWPVWAKIIEKASPYVPIIKITIGAEAYKQEIKDCYHTLTGKDLPSNVEFFKYSTTKFWLRDYGPQFVAKRNDKLGVINWTYPLISGAISSANSSEFTISYEDNQHGGGGADPNNLYPRGYYQEYQELFSTYISSNLKLSGGNFQTDGNGIGYVSNITYENNNATTEEDIRNEIKERYNLKEVRVLPKLPQNDETGHIDMYFYITSPDTVIVAKFPEDIGDNEKSLDTNYEVAEYAVEQFKSWGFKVYRVETPADGGGKYGPFVYSYTNAIILNDIVLIPSFSGYDILNEDAREIFKEIFPEKKIISINSSVLIERYGAIHCITLSRPPVTGGI